MTVKILSSSGTFSGVRYNTNKMQDSRGELMKAKNFGLTNTLSEILPEDYINYLKLYSSTNNRVKSPQFHAAISCKGKEYNKNELTEIAEKWLDLMGYKHQPYLIVFHKDTNNNHVHIVSSRIDINGKKISDSFEKIKAVNLMNKVMGLDENIQVKKDINAALKFNFSTKAQFLMLLESKGYMINQNSKNYEIIKFGKILSSIEISEINNKVSDYKKNTQRIAQIRAILENHRYKNDTTLKPKTNQLPGGNQNKNEYTSDLAIYLKDKLGIELIFHSKDNDTPYGYTIIDHAKQNVFKGSDIMNLKTLLSDAPRNIKMNQSSKLLNEDPLNNNLIDEGTTNNKPSPNVEVNTNTTIGINTTSENEYEKTPREEFSKSNTINIADDVDDEQINGRNRKRKKMARTNTR